MYSQLCKMHNGYEYFIIDIFGGCKHCQATTEFENNFGRKRVFSQYRVILKIEEDLMKDKYIYKMNHMIIPLACLFGFQPLGLYSISSQSNSIVPDDKISFSQFHLFS